MAYYDEKQKQIIIEEGDFDTTDKNWANRIISKIIWGDKKPPPRENNIHD